jgi:hypothetical protein
MAWGALTDDNSVWPEDQPAQPNPPPDAGFKWSPGSIPGILASLWSGATLPGDVATGKASMADPQTQARVGDLTGVSMLGAGAAPAASSDAMNMGFRLYHGTAANFEKPSTKFINTGQGAQTYGWGLYGAQAEPVALDMRDQLATDPRQIVNKALHTAANIKNTALPDDDPTHILGLVKQYLTPYLPDTELRDLATKAVYGTNPDGTYTQEGINAFRQLDTRLPPPNRGHMQEWNVNADPEHFLEWEQHLSDQSPYVENAAADLAAKMRLPMGNATGQHLYQRLREATGGPQEASQALGEAGIPGIRVLDQLSRRKMERSIAPPESELSRNFVIPDENLIEVVRRYGLAGLGVALGAGALTQQPTPATAAPATSR